MDKFISIVIIAGIAFMLLIYNAVDEMAKMNRTPIPQVYYKAFES